MAQDSPIDDLDLRLIHALQLEPRVSWTALAPIVGADAATLARRWERIERSGSAWLTTLPGLGAGSATALVEVACRPGQVIAAASALAEDPAVYSIDLTSGRRDLLATVVAADDRELADVVLDRFGAVAGLRSIQTHVVNRIIRLGSGWTVGALTPAEAARVPRPRPPRPGAARHVDPELALRLRRLLERDGRLSFQTMADRLGISAQRASDYLARLRADGDLLIRTDVSGPYSSWPIVSWYFLQAPSPTAQLAGELLADMPQLQFAVISTGPANLIAAVSARSREEVVEREAELERRLHGARIVDRSMVLRMHKHLGRLIDPDGFATGEAVPLA